MVLHNMAIEFGESEVDGEEKEDPMDDLLKSVAMRRRGAQEMRLLTRSRCGNELIYV
jgi:hypothetical protein